MSRSNVCFVPGCRTNYLSDRKRCKSEGKKVNSLFKAPRDTNLFEEWKKVVYRADKEFSKESCVCELHFSEDDIEKFYTTVLRDGTVNKIERGTPLLKKGAIPCILPYSSVLSKNVKRKVHIEQEITKKVKKMNCDLETCDKKKDVGIRKYSVQRKFPIQQEAAEAVESKICEKKKDEVSESPVVFWVTQSVPKKNVLSETKQSNCQRDVVKLPAMYNQSSLAHQKTSQVSDGPVDLCDLNTGDKKKDDAVGNYSVQRKLTIEQGDAEAVESKICEKKKGEVSESPGVYWVTQSILKTNALSETQQSNCQRQVVKLPSLYNQISLAHQKTSQLPDKPIQLCVKNNLSFEQNPVEAGNAQRFELKICEKGKNTTNVNANNAPAFQELNFKFLLENVNLIKMPSKWWSLTSTPQYLVCSKWTTDYMTERKVVITQDLSIKVYFKDWQFDVPSKEVNSVNDISAFLQSVNSFALCTGIPQEFERKCLVFLPEKKTSRGRHTNWCEECRAIRKSLLHAERRQDKRDHAIATKRTQLSQSLICEKRKNFRLQGKVNRLKERIATLKGKCKTTKSEQQALRNAISSLHDSQQESDQSLIQSAKMHSRNDYEAPVHSTKTSLAPPKLLIGYLQPKRHNGYTSKQGEHVIKQIKRGNFYYSNINKSEIGMSET